MKIVYLLIFLSLIFLPLVDVEGQSKRETKNRTSEEKKNNSINDFSDEGDINAIEVSKEIDDFGNKIDNFVNKLVNRWSSKFNDDQIDNDSLETKSKKSENDNEIEFDEKANTFSGDKIIEESETIKGPVVVKGGNLIVYGSVDGDVLVVGGDLHIKSNGKVTGNARVINGSIIKDDGGVIKGHEDKTIAKKTNYRETDKKFQQSTRSFEVPWRNDQMNFDNFVFRYNRVESIFLGLGTKKKYYWDGERNWNAYGSIGWGFKSHTWRGNLGITRQFATSTDENNGLFEIGGEIYSLTDTKDHWIISIHENTAAALFMHEDFRDYYERNGYTIYSAYYTKKDYLKSELKVAYLADKYDSMTNKVEWAMFGGNKLFRLNPPINAGDMRSIMFNGGFNTVTKTSIGPEGWSLFAIGEFAKKSIGGIFDFEQYMVDIRRLQPLGKYENINIRLRVGSASGTLPKQKLYELGGLGTIEAFPFKSFIGNRMLLVNTEFIINGSFLHDLDFWPTWLFKHFNFMLISNAGFTRDVASKLSAVEGFNDIRFNEFNHSFGICLVNRSGSFRIGMAWRTDRPAPAQLVLRFNRPF